MPDERDPDGARMDAAMAAVRQALGDGPGFLLVAAFPGEGIARVDATPADAKDIFRQLPNVALALCDLTRRRRPRPC